MVADQQEAPVAEDVFRAVGLHAEIAFLEQHQQRRHEFDRLGIEAEGIDAEFVEVLAGQGINAGADPGVQQAVDDVLDAGEQRHEFP